MGIRTINWAMGAGGGGVGNAAESQDVIFGVTSWQGAGGQAAGSRGALYYQLRQLEQLASNPDYQPVFIQWTSTAQSGGQLNATEPHDGWYLLSNLQPNYLKNVNTGYVTCRMTVALIAPATPSALAVSYTGAAMASTYSAAAVPLIGFPLGATANPPTTGSRTGGEGAIPISTSPAPNPVPFLRPGSLASLYDGGVRVLDTISTGSNPVPVAGGVFLNANWVQVYGTAHDFVGDMVVTNGLVLLLFQTGQTNICTVYLWNTSLGTPTWQSMGPVQYQDNAGNVGTLRTLDLDRVGMEEVQLRARCSTSAGNWSGFTLRLQRGCYHVYIEVRALTESWASKTNLVWNTTAVYATGFTDATSSTTFPSDLATTTVSGYSAAQGSGSGAPILGWLYQNIGNFQGRLVSTSAFGLGDTFLTPGLGAATLYGFFVVPYSGAVVLATARGIVAPLYQQFRFSRETVWVQG